MITSASIDGTTLFYGEQYTVSWEANSEVSFVYAKLFLTGADSDVFQDYLTPYPYKIQANAGKQTFTVPNKLPSRSGYYIQISDAAFENGAKAPRSTKQFAIQELDKGPCRPGYASTTGNHPCTPCKAGTYWQDTKNCVKCPNGQTTLDHFAKSVSECVATPVASQSKFFIQPQRYLHKSNGVFYKLDDHDHLSPAECAQLCLNNKLCQSFDLGSSFQTGDCFGSYDTKDTVMQGQFRSVQQLNYYERKEKTDIISTAFTVKKNCYIVGSDDLLKVSRDLDTTPADQAGFSPQHCAAECMRNPRCKSIDVGRREAPGTYREYCYLSLENEDDARQRGPEYFVCGGESGFDYYEKKPEFFNKATMCKPGTVSSTGHSYPEGVTCELCPVGTFSSFSGTQCVSCPRGMTSRRGSTKLSDCFILEVGSSPTGLFTLGANFHGTYTTKITDYYTKKVRDTEGSVELEVVQINAATKQVFFMVTMLHGEYCNPAYDNDFWKKCRVAGRSEWYVKCTVENNKCVTEIDTTKGQRGWSGITDRSTVRENFSGVVRVVGENTIFEGVYGQGNFKVTERCFASQEAGTFSVGDYFVGRYYCYRGQVDGREPKIGEFDVRRLDARVEDVDGEGNVKLVVNVNYASGIGEYEGYGKYNGDTRSITVTPKFGSWVGKAPESAVAHTLVGQLSADGEFYFGQVQKTKACECLGRDASPENNKSPETGSKCGVWPEYPERKTAWCYVGHECPEAVTETGMTGHYWHYCDQSRGCDSFRLTRVCAEADTKCPNGWLVHNSRCYKFERNPANFPAAQAACQRQRGGHLVSIHGSVENGFVTDTLKTVGIQQAWVGVQEKDGKEMWTDESLYTYADWAANEPSIDGGCGSLLSASGDWKAEACLKPLPYMCKALPLARDYKCECTGENDYAGHGGTCRSWTENQEAWCYMTENCNRAAPVTELNANGQQVTMWRAVCSPAEKTGTFDNNGKPATCAITCATCSGPEHNDCTSCGGSLFLYNGECVVSCPGEMYGNTESNTCEACPKCKANQYELSGCAPGKPRECAPLSTCQVGAEFELKAPTSTSDRICKNVRECRTGQFASKDPTATTDRRCEFCPAGTTDHDYDWKTPCQACGAGHYLPVWTITLANANTKPRYGIGPCDIFQCPAGTKGSSDPSTKCVACKKGEEFQSQAGQTECVPQKKCAAGESPSTVVTTVADVSCQPCFLGLTYKDTEGNTPCKRISTCGAGQENLGAATTTKDTQCRTCATGTYIDSTLTQCKPWTKCAPGEEEDPNQRASASQDRACITCKPGFFSAGNGAACKAWKVCSANQYEVAAPTAFSDRTCVAAKTCNADEYVVSQPKGDKNRVCAAMEKCVLTQTYRAPLNNFDAFGNNLDNAKCLKCSVCGEIASSPCTTTQDAVCANCGRACTKGEYEVSPCTADGPRQCQTCTACTADQYESVSCSVGSNRECAFLSICSFDEIEISPATTTSDRQCVKKRQCIPGEYVNPKPTSSEDVCIPCSDGFFSTLYDSAECQRQTVCPKGEGMYAPPTKSVDTICIACQGTIEFKPTKGNVKCTPITQDDCPIGTKKVPSDGITDAQCVQCPENEYQDTAGRSYCVEQSSCAAGTAEDVPGTPATRRTCKPCITGFTTEENSPICKAWTVCGPGTQAKPNSATALSDTTCEPCPKGTFKATTSNLDRCTPYKLCNSGFEPEPNEADILGPDSDRICKKCDPGFFQSRDNTLVPCSAVKTCKAGTKIENGQILTRDRDVTCVDCPRGEYQPDANQRECIEYRTCDPGFQASAPPPGPAKTDLVCTPCLMGLFKANQGRDRCRPWKSCDAGEKIDTSVVPSTTVDRNCLKCDANEISDGTTAMCTPASTCKPGTYVLAAHKGAEDRVCEDCAQGTFTTNDNAEKCVEWKKAENGQYVSKSGTASSDNELTTCDNLPSDTADVPSTCTDAAASASNAAAGGGSSGAVAGGVIGGLLAVALLVAGAFYYRKRQQSAGANTSVGVVSYTNDGGDGHASFENPLYDMTNLPPKEGAYDMVQDGGAVAPSEPAYDVALPEGQYDMPQGGDSGYQEVVPFDESTQSEYKKMYEAEPGYLDVSGTGVEVPDEEI